MNSRGGLLVLSLVLVRVAVACSDTPLSTPASDGNYDDEGAPGNMNDPGSASDAATTVHYDSSSDVQSTPDSAPDAQIDAAIDAPVDAPPDASADAMDDAPAADGEPDADVGD